MQNLQVKIASIIVKILDMTLMGLKVNPKKITYISYRYNKLPYSMKMISEELKKIDDDYEEIYLSMKFKNTLLNKVRYFFEIIKQVVHIKTSKIVIIDGNNIVISNMKIKDTKVIQIWHASSAIKKFGQDYKRRYPLTKCDYMITASSKSKEIMSSAFNIEKERVMPLGYIESDVLFDKDTLSKYKEEMYEKYPVLRNKKVVLYAPTFRGDAIYDKKTLNIDLKKISSELNDEYVVIYKMHPIIDNSNIEECSNLYNMNNIDIYKLFSVTDILVSDYSSIISDYLIMEKPIILYVPDLESYEKERGLYVNYKEFAPGPIIYNEDELIKTIQNNNYNINKVKTMKEEFYDYKDGKTSERLAQFIHKTCNNT